MQYWRGEKLTPDKASLKQNKKGPQRKLSLEQEFLLTLMKLRLEIFTETPSSLEVQAALWSEYKHHCTVKVLIAITPNGAISYLSDCYGGRASDKFIVEDSDFLERLRPGDQLMADRGIFVSPALVARETNNMGMAIVIWILAGIPCLFGALCYCELACMYGKAGGTYLFILEAYGKVAGFFIIWANNLVMIPIGVAIPAVVIGENITWFFYDLKSSEGILLVKSIAILFVLIPALINIFSVSFASKTQMIFTIVQIIAVVFLVALGAWQIGLGHTTNYLVMFNNTQKSFDFGSFGLAFYNALWSYEGWGEVTMLIEELKDLKTNLWLSIITGIPFVIFCYVLTNLALVSVLSHKEAGRSTTIAVTFVEKILGRRAAIVIPIAVALSSFGCLNANMFLFPRMIIHDNLPVCVKNGSTFFNEFLLAKFNLVPCIFEGESNTDNFVQEDHL
eukprot:gene15332-biopygen12763